jgi:hypothetical protein
MGVRGCGTYRIPRYVLCSDKWTDQARPVITMLLFGCASELDGLGCNVATSSPTSSCEPPLQMQPFTPGSRDQCKRLRLCPLETATAQPYEGPRCVPSTVGRPIAGPSPAKRCLITPLPCNKHQSAKRRWRGLVRTNLRGQTRRGHGDDLECWK